MARRFAWIVTMGLLSTPLLAQTAEEQQRPQDPRPRAERPARPQDPNHWKWWINPEHRKELSITDAQSAQIEEIFEALFPAQRDNWREAEKLEPLVTKMLKDSTADVATVKQQVERLEKMNAERRTMRAVMLYRMGLVLTPDQRVRLEAFMKRRNDSRRPADRDKSDRRH